MGRERRERRRKGDNHLVSASYPGLSVQSLGGMVRRSNPAKQRVEENGWRPYMANQRLSDDAASQVEKERTPGPASETGRGAKLCRSAKAATAEAAVVLAAGLNYSMEQSCGVLKARPAINIPSGKTSNLQTY
ncbi:unnamed protein product [Pleuronectes platessa]|uniref:Uncharacterized protein n=1 Tax=Pleuronectes platessa TaxID=8262 RepID=A0A9N7U3A5_PLEPL|nr:unnamed protein product [Pleuronectes platessa]